MAVAIQSRLSHVVIGKKDTRLTLNNEQHLAIFLLPKSTAHSATMQYHSRVFVNSSPKDTAGASKGLC